MLGVCVLECLITQLRLRLSSPYSKTLLMPIPCWSKQTCAELCPNCACRLPWFSSSWCPQSACFLQLARRLCSPADKRSMCLSGGIQTGCITRGQERINLVHVLVTEARSPINRSSIVSNSCISWCDSLRSGSTKCYSSLIITSQGVFAQQRMLHKCNPNTERTQYTLRYMLRSRSYRLKHRASISLTPFTIGLKSMCASMSRSRSTPGATCTTSAALHHTVHQSSVDTLNAQATTCTALSTRSCARMFASTGLRQSVCPSTPVRSSVWWCSHSSSWGFLHVPGSAP